MNPNIKSTGGSIEVPVNARYPHYKILEHQTKRGHEPQPFRDWRHIQTAQKQAESSKQPYMTMMDRIEYTVSGVGFPMTVDHAYELTDVDIARGGPYNTRAFVAEQQAYRNQIAHGPYISIDYYLNLMHNFIFKPSGVKVPITVPCAFK